VSFLTGTQTEILYASIATGTQLNTFTTEDNLQKTLAPVIIPAGFFYNNGAAGKSLKVRAWGRLGTTSGPTFTFTVRLIPSTVTWSAGGIAFSTAALTAGTTQTLSPWLLEADITMRSIGVGAASTIICMGMVEGALSLASPFAGSIPANNTAITNATYDNSLFYTLWLSAACGTSNALNLIQLELLKVFGEN
jgi:hypothetical protein